MISFVYIAAAPLIYKIFFPKYLDAVFFSQLFSIAIALSLPQAVFGAAVAAKIPLLSKKMLYLYNIPGIVFIISAFVLVQTLGVSGVILGRLFSHASTFLINYIQWEKIKKAEAPQ